MTKNFTQRVALRIPKKRLTVLLAGVLVALATTMPAQAEPETKEREIATMDVSDIVAARPNRLGIPFGIHQGDRTSGRQRRSEEPPAWIHSADELIELVKATVAHSHPGAFVDYEGEDIASGGSILVIRARPRVMKATRLVIASLREEAVTRATISVSASRGSDNAYPATVAQPSEVRRGQVDAPWDSVRTLSSLDHVTYVSDYEVEIAQGVAIANPRVDGAVGGLQAELKTRPIADGTKALVSGILKLGDVVVRRSARLGVDEEYLPKPPRTNSSYTHGTLQLPDFSHVYVAFNTVLPYGESLHIPCVVDGAQTSFAVRVNQPRTPSSADRFRTGYLTYTPLSRSVVVPPLRSFNFGDHERLTPYFVRPPHVESLMPIENVIEWMKSTNMNGALLEEDWEDMTIFRYNPSMLSFHGTGAQENALRAAIAKLESTLLRPTTVAIVVQAIGTEGSEMAPVRLAAARIPALSGRWSSMLAGKTAAYLADYDVEVAQESRIADPIVSHRFGGLACSVLPMVPADGTRATIAVNVAFDVPTGAPTNFSMGPRYLGDLQQVRTHRIGVNTSASIELGKPHRVAAGTHPSFPKRTIVIDVTVEAP